MIILLISINICFEMVILSIHNICFGSEIEKYFLFSFMGSTVAQ